MKNNSTWIFRNSYKILSEADLLVIPSFSEGTSRAVLEALYLGVPSLIKRVDGNDELIKEEYGNGKLFSNNNEIKKFMIQEVIKSRLREKRRNLLPPKYRSENVKEKYIKLFKNLIKDEI